MYHRQRVQCVGESGDQRDSPGVLTVKSCRHLVRERVDDHSAHAADGDLEQDGEPDGMTGHRAERHEQRVARCPQYLGHFILRKTTRCQRFTEPEVLVAVVGRKEIRGVVNSGRDDRHEQPRDERRCPDSQQIKARPNWCPHHGLEKLSSGGPIEQFIDRGPWRGSL